MPDAFQTYTVPAGLFCSFAVFSEPVVNRLVTTTFPADRNGDVLQLTTGTLVARFTNVTTGKSITVTVSGPGRFTIHPDGTATLEALGNWALAGVRPSSGERVLWLTTGRVVVEYPATPDYGTIVSSVGRQVDLCAELS